MEYSFSADIVTCDQSPAVASPSRLSGVKTYV